MQRDLTTAGPSGRVDPGSAAVGPPRVGAELISPGNALVLWCAAGVVVDVLDALKLAGVDTKRKGPLDRFHHVSLHDERRRRHERERDRTTPSDTTGHDPEPPLPAVANCADAMACSKHTDAPVFYWEVRLTKYEQIVLHLKRKRLVHPNYAPRADGGVSSRRGLVPSSTFLVCINSRYHHGKSSGVSSNDGAGNGRNDVDTNGTANAGTDVVSSDGGRTTTTHATHDDQHRNRENYARALARRFDSIPPGLRNALYPFQKQGVLFGLARSGRCLIADQMGVGKTIQALAIASCYRDEGPLLVAVPASMRLAWARECERWFPGLLTKNLVVVNGAGDSFAVETVRAVGNKLRELREGEARDSGEGDAGVERVNQSACTQNTKKNATLMKELQRQRVVVVSFQMASRLIKTLTAIKWGAVIVDESHALRTTGGFGKDADCGTKQTAAVVKLIKTTKRAVLCTGTPSLTKPFDLFNQIDSLRPGLLGRYGLLLPWAFPNPTATVSEAQLPRTKKAFAENYCDLQISEFQTVNGYAKYDRSGGSRLRELHALLTAEVMIRRLKKDVLSDLPPKRRQVVPIDVCGSVGDVGTANRRNDDKRKQAADAEDFEDPPTFDAAAAADDDDSGDESDDASSSDDDSHETRAARVARIEAKSTGSNSKLREASLLKLPGAVKWLREVLSVDDDAPAGGVTNPSHDNCAIRDSTELDDDDVDQRPPKMVIFAHHIDVMDRIVDQVLHRLPRVRVRNGTVGNSAVDERGDKADERVDRAHATTNRNNPNPRNTERTVEGFIRIDGSTLPRDRGDAVDRFRDDPFCRVALVSVTAGGVGIDLSASSSVVFVELPPDASLVEQAEDRVHRRGLKNAVNVYFLLAHGGAAGRVEERRWASIERSLNKVRRAVDGETVIEDRGLAPDTVGLGFAPGSERQPFASERSPTACFESSHQNHDFTDKWLGVEDPPRVSLEKENREGDTFAKRMTSYASPASPENLWFEVSHNTGRVHLHASLTGADPLGESVAPNDLKRVAGAIQREIRRLSGTGSSGCTRGTAEGIRTTSQGTTVTPDATLQELEDAVREMSSCATLPPRLRGNVGSVLAAKAFLDEFDALTSTDRNLLAKGHVPVKSPIADTVCLLQGNAGFNGSDFTSRNSALGGLHNGLSTRRHGAGRRVALPVGAEMRRAIVAGEGVTSREYLEPVDTATGTPLCLMCMSPRSGLGGTRVASLQIEDILFLSNAVKTNAVRTHATRKDAQETQSTRVSSEYPFYLSTHQLYPSSPREACVAARDAVSAARDALAAAAVAESSLRLAGAGGGGVSAARNVNRRIALANAAAAAKAAAMRVTEVTRAAERAELEREKSNRLTKEVTAAGGATETQTTANDVCAEFVYDAKVQLFCSEACHSLDKQQVSSSELRRLLYEKDKGVCVWCAWDASACARRVAVMRSKTSRRRYILKSNKKFSDRGNGKLLDLFVRTAWEGHAWHFDHIKPVYKGGGECTVDNGQTLCVLCHKQRTAGQAKERAATRRVEKETVLKTVLRKNKKVKSAAETVTAATATDTKKLFSAQSDEKKARTRGKRAASSIPVPALIKGYVEDSQLASTDEETEVVDDAPPVVVDFEPESKLTDSDSLCSLDSEPIPETEPVGVYDRYTNTNAGYGTEINVVPETELHGPDTRPGPAFAGTALFDLDENEKFEDSDYSRKDAAKKKDAFMEMLESDDDVPWTY